VKTTTHVLGSLLGGKNRPDPEASAEVGNEWSYTSAPPVCFHCV